MHFLGMIQLIAGHCTACGRGHSARMHAAPIEAFEKCAQLRRGQTHHAVLHARPVELAVLQTLAEQAKARAVPEDELHPVGSFRAKQ